MRWLEPVVTGTPPGPCNMHTADFIKSLNQVLVFRGGDGREYVVGKHSRPHPHRHHHHQHWHQQQQQQHRLQPHQHFP